MTGRRVLAWLVLVVFGVLAAGTVLWPSGILIRTVQIQTWSFVAYDVLGGRLSWFTPEVWSDVVNVALFVPPTAAVVVLRRRDPWWAWFLAGSAASVVAEVVQATAYAGQRLASAHDVLVNGGGAFLGALLGAALREPAPAPEPPGSPGTS